MAFLPTNLPDWEPWRKEIEKRILAANATDDLRILNKAGCTDELLFRLASVVAWHGGKAGGTGRRTWMGFDLEAESNDKAGRPQSSNEPWWPWQRASLKGKQTSDGRGKDERETFYFYSVVDCFITASGRRRGRPLLFAIGSMSNPRSPKRYVHRGKANH